MEEIKTRIKNKKNNIGRNRKVWRAFGPGAQALWWEKANRE